MHVYAITMNGRMMGLQRLTYNKFWQQLSQQHHLRRVVQGRRVESMGSERVGILQAEQMKIKVTHGVDFFPHSFEITLISKVPLVVSNLPQASVLLREESYIR